MILQPGESQRYPLSGKYLIARKIVGKIFISDASIGMPDTEVRQSDIITLADSTLITVRNGSAAIVDIELQSTTVPIITNDGGAVTIAGGSIDSILQPISVTAEATVENGTVTSQSPNINSQVADITIAAGATTTILAASPTDKRRVAILQNISDTATVLRIGGAPTVNAGAILAGSIDGIASLEFDTIGELKAFNASAQPAKVSVMWGKR